MSASRTPLAQLDEAAANAFWHRYLTATGADPGDGYSDPSRVGQKGATASRVDEDIPVIFERFAVPHQE